MLKDGLIIHFRDGEVAVRAGEMYAVKKGIEHKPSAASEAKLLSIGPKTVLNTAMKRMSGPP